MGGTGHGPIAGSPVKEGGLGDFFRNATVKPGHPPMDLPLEEFVKLLEQYGMILPRAK